MRRPAEPLRGRARWHWRAVLAARAAAGAIGGRGLGHAVDALGRAFGATGSVILPIFGSRAFACELSDGYWLPAALRGGGYEPEVEGALRLLLTPATTFVDCGANLGWWSLFASETIPDPRRILAVEAAPWTFAALTRNGVINGEVFTPVGAAIWDAKGKRIAMRTDPRRHAWASVDTRLDGQLGAAGFESQEVETTTVDALVRAAPPAERVVIKLDVEGVELRALAGARETLAGNAVVIYEDHGRDAGARTTQGVIVDFGLDVFFLDDAATLRRFTLADAVAVKDDPSRGYNLVACAPGSPVHARLCELASVP